MLQLIKMGFLKERDRTSLLLKTNLDPDLPIAMKNSEVYHKYKDIFQTNGS